jgi:hypothetical protein
MAGIGKTKTTKKKSIKYRTNFGQCPSRVAGSLVLKVIKSFEERMSLKDVKKLILVNKLQEKHYISSYKIDYDPLTKLLDMRFECPKPLMKVQIYKKNGLESYEAILVDSGKLLDPTYEVLLRAEKKLTRELPYLAIPVGRMEEPLRKEVASLVSSMPKPIQKNLSEIILNAENELTVILSISGHPSSVFLGDDDWGVKMERLYKIVNYMSKKNRMPAIINITNAEKVVVKFNDRF